MSMAIMNRTAGYDQDALQHGSRVRGFSFWGKLSGIGPGWAECGTTLDGGGTGGEKAWVGPRHGPLDSILTICISRGLEQMHYIWCILLASADEYAYA